MSEFFIDYDPDYGELLWVSAGQIYKWTTAIRFIAMNTYPYIFTYAIYDGTYNRGVLAVWKDEEVLLRIEQLSQEKMKKIAEFYWKMIK